jgi:hypothetical protein
LLIFGTPFSGGESEGLPNLRAWGGCEAEPPGLTLAIILFWAEIETRAMILYGITAVSGVECELSAPDEFTAVTVYM